MAQALVHIQKVYVHSQGRQCGGKILTISETWTRSYNMEVARSLMYRQKNGLCSFGAMHNQLIFGNLLLKKYALFTATS